MLHIVTDGAVDLPPTWQKEYEINVVPINIQFGENTYLQYTDLSIEGFYDMVERTHMVPKTSQPSPFQFSQFYQKIAQPGDTILSLHVTSRLSGTYESALAAARELKDKFRILPFDSLSGSMAMGFMCKIARQMDRAGRKVEDILAYLESVRDRVAIVLTLDKLDYARMSGRVKALPAALANVLNIKPIVELKSGFLAITEKVRTRKASLEQVIEIARQKFGDSPVHLAVLHARDQGSGHALLEQARKTFNVVSSELTDLSIAIAINLGPGTVGLVLYPAT